ncbi:MAG: prepilin-type N-terminal cleavage/methylation domain-containing protein [Planctomycetaceae bacterium]|jgi:prepilin-type N-terminal cleavage/methylation domain-containing protein|nr:prepilin-type N-terminal cleavage/methylation domain-containing protein [Planctomycetaceae bacterium]
MFNIKRVSETGVNRRGLTIIEVMISIVILGSCLAIISELGRSSFRNAMESRNMTQAELLAENILAQVQLGIIEMKPVVDTPVTSRTFSNDVIEDTDVISEGNANDVLWLYSIDINNVDNSENLIELSITVTQNPAKTDNPVRCYLVRWIIVEEEEEE